MGSVANINKYAVYFDGGHSISGSDRDGRSAAGTRVATHSYIAPVWSYYMTFAIGAYYRLDKHGWFSLTVLFNWYKASEWCGVGVSYCNCWTTIDRNTECKDIGRKYCIVKSFIKTRVILKKILALLVFS